MAEIYSNLLEDLCNIEMCADPSEVHGSLCGFLCARQKQTAGAWIEEIAPQASRDDKEKLAALFELTEQQLNSPDLDIRLFLPDDQAPLSERTEALASWSRGLLYGLGIGGLGKETILDDDIQEFLTDVAKIAKAVHYPETDTHEDEVAYSELVEYLRMGLLLVYESLHPTDRDSPPET
ncbi:conserved hypothetical protein [Nitrosococcus halophilus Nc 4]|uniref:YecA family protein n=1 Tax=Nitrosococcus halophilus (strain Nc4) TaxID=472759 RepID=D5C2R0_NITHN|nr:UPF0149 family protein [Nitrosococcus halophilus]ADE16735.1 conserved hypothetical protein [Nitrosococcus halophilus Nc 4]